MIGKEVGGALSYNVFIYLNSADISKSVFHHDGPILSVSGFFYILGAMLFVLFLVLMFFVKEKRTKQKKKKLSVQYKYLSQFLLNK